MNGIQSKKLEQTIKDLESAFMNRYRFSKAKISDLLNNLGEQRLGQPSLKKIIPINPKGAMRLIEEGRADPNLETLHDFLKVRSYLNIPGIDLLFDKKGIKPDTESLFLLLQRKLYCLVKKFIENGAIPDTECLNVVIRYGNKFLAEEFLKRGATPTTESLYLALSYYDLRKLVGEFLKMGVIPDTRCLDVVIRYGNKFLAEEFLEKGATPNTESLYLALSYDFRELAGKFLEKGAILDTRCLNLLMRKGGTIAEVRLFLERGAIPDAESLYLALTLQQYGNLVGEFSKKIEVNTIVTLLLREDISLQEKIYFADMLRKSSNRKISEVGCALFQAFKADTFTEAIPYYYNLMNLLKLKYNNIKAIFKRPFIEFGINRYHDDPDFVKRLPFVNGKFFVYKNLIVGIVSRGLMLLDYLLAYDINTEELKWGFPLGEYEYRLHRVGDKIVLQLLGGKIIKVIQVETGKVINEIFMPPFLYDNQYDRSHCTSDDFVYQTVLNEKKFIIGKVEEQSLIDIIESEYSGETMVPLSTHVGFESCGVEGEFLIVGPTGDQVTIKNCGSAKAWGNKLYAIEKELSRENYFLTVRTLKTDEEVISEIEKKIEIGSVRADLGELYGEKKCILFSNYSIIFVDLDKQKIISVIKLNEDFFFRAVNSETGEVWLQCLARLLKVSPSGKVCSLLPIKNIFDSKLCYVSTENRLYFRFLEC